VKLLITSISGGGKTYFCNSFLQQLHAEHFNNDRVREATNNHDFSMAGRILAAKNMREMVDASSADIKLIDMICPTKELRKIIDPDVIVYIKSDRPSKYPDTDALYEEPTYQEARYFFSCFSRKTDRLVDYVVYWLGKNFR
jgi:hypothetical protein